MSETQQKNTNHINPPINTDQNKLTPYAIANNYRNINNIILKNIDNIPHPFLTLEGHDFPDFVFDTIRTHGFKEFTPIQAQGIPIIMSGRDFIGISKTGSGKTIAYLIPAILHILQNQESRGPIILVLSPTRELAMQIQNEFRKFLTKSKIHWACVYGGIKKQLQRSVLLRNIQILVATPGRLIDFIQQGSVNIQNVSYFVLDQADRMLDMGFLPQIRQINSYLIKQKQSLMFSATWPYEIKQLAQKYLIDPVSLQIGVLQRAINQKIKQQIKIVDTNNKFQQLLKDLNKYQERRLVFVQKKIDCEALCDHITSQGIRCISIHGDKPQILRDKALNLFKSGKVKILIATDVASRGLDIPDVQLVINFDFPKQIQDYIHRIGRTGRAGKSGVTISYLKQGQDNRIGEDLMKLLKQCKQQFDTQELYQFSRRKGTQKYDKYKTKYSTKNLFPSRSSFDPDNWRSSNNRIAAKQNIWRPPLPPKSMKNFEISLISHGNVDRPFLKSEKIIPLKTNKNIYRQKIYHPSLTFDCHSIFITVRFFDVEKINTEVLIVPCLQSDKQHKLTRKMNQLLGINLHEFLNHSPLGIIKKCQSPKLKTINEILSFYLIQQDDGQSSFLSYILTKILNSSEANGYQSIALYQLGMGKYTFESEAKTMIYSLFEILQMKKLSYLQQIEIIVENEKEFCEYIKVYQNLIKNAYENQLLQIQND